MNRTFLLLVLGLTIIYSCEQKPAFNESEARAQILELHHAQRKHHFEKLIAESEAILSDSFISINRGEITQPTREESTARRKRYYDSVEFEKWDDLEPPVIRFSDDGSLAYTAVHKVVTATYQNENQEQERGTTEFAWLAIYKKYPEGWKIDCVASTNKPDIITPVDKD